MKGDWKCVSFVAPAEFMVATTWWTDMEKFIEFRTVVNHVYEYHGVLWLRAMHFCHKLSNNEERECADDFSFTQWAKKRFIIFVCMNCMEIMEIARLLLTMRHLRHTFSFRFLFWIFHCVRRSTILFSPVQPDNDNNNCGFRRRLCAIKMLKNICILWSNASTCPNDDAWCCVRVYSPNEWVFCFVAYSPKKRTHSYCPRSNCGRLYEFSLL